MTVVQTLTPWPWAARIDGYAASEQARGRRERGIASYLKTLQSLGTFAEGRDPSAVLVAEWLDSWASSGPRAPATIGAALSAVRSFGLWLKKRGYCEADLLALVERPRMPRRDVICAPREQVLRAAAWMQSQEAPGRSRRFAALCLYAGLRFTEARLLEWRDIDELAGELVVRPEGGKGGRSRRIPIAPPLARLLGEVPRHERVGAVAGRLEGGTLSRGAAEHIFDRELRRAGVTLSPHMLRRAFATVLDEKGHSLRVLQELLGHSSLATTERYIGVDRKRKVAAVADLDGAFGEGGRL